MAPLPTGSVTFLFTDIEGSTRLLQELGSGYRAVQDRHAEIMRTAIAEGSGHEVRTEGDSFFVAFRSPLHAVRAAVDAQRGLAEAQWPGGAPLRVRMGLHTGEAELGGDDYLGIDVNRAARISAAGHGGQILLSAATRGLIEHDLPEGVRLRDLGQHRLKDIAHPEHLFDLVIEGLPSDFPPPRTLDARPNNLPLQLTSFVGRGAEIAEGARLIGEHRLVTLTGPGGTGKTRLALEVAAEVLPRFPDGACFVDLASIAEPALVPPAIGRALGVKEEPGRGFVDTLAEQLADKELLLVPDNFEHLVEAAAVVERLLGAAPRLRVLATSRTPLGLYGEQEQQVPSLRLPDPAHLDLEALTRVEAVALFAERARAARADFEVTEDNGQTVAGICARLDGLPLAIELAASRIKVLSPQAILSRLGDRLDLLVASARNLPERQRSLRGAIEWSYELLGEAERRLFARFSVFAGGAELGAIEAVCSANGPLELDPLDGVTSLVDDSLVRRTGNRAEEPRFAMLETIREYAGERLRAEFDADATRRRHADHFMALAEESEHHLVDASGPDWLDRLDHEQDNLMDALAWSIEAGEADRGMRAAASVWRFWQLRGHFDVGRRWLERLLDVPGHRTAARAKAHGAAGSLAYWQVDVAETERHYEESLTIYDELGDRRGMAEATYNLAFLPVIRGTGAEESTRLLRQAIELYQELGDEAGTAKAKGDLGLFLMMSGDHRAALPILEESLARTRERGDLFRLFDDIGRVAEAHRVLGDLDEARRGYLEALDVVERANTPSGIAALLQLMASVESDLGRHRRAARLFGAGGAIARSIGRGDVPEQLRFADPVGEARRAIGDEAVDRALTEGRGMTLDQAVAYARSLKPSD